MTIREMITCLDRDVDVCDNYTDEWCISFCGWGSKPTEEGWKEFESIMDLEVEVDGDYAVVKIDHLGDDVIDDIQHEVKRFFFSHAGYCNCDDYDKWFVVED